jgi:glycosyltransferase involved in cell wall biosynthesis
VLEAMALQKPVVEFDVGGVARQVGETGVLVPPGDVEAFANAVMTLISNSDSRRKLGLAAAERVRRLFDRPGFEADLLDLLRGVADNSTSSDESFVLTRRTINVPNRAPISDPMVVDVLHAFDPSALIAARSGSGSVLPYRTELLAESGCNVVLTDSMYRGFWQRSIVQNVVGRAEQFTAPFLQTLLSWRNISRADAVVSVFESQANSLAALRSLRLPGLRRPRLVVVACWLSRDLGRFGRVRKAVYRFSYRSVDKLVFFSSNQADVFRRELGLHDDRLSCVAFGVDHEYFRPRPGSEGEAVVAIGRDLGRDWPTFLDAVRGASFAVEVACRPETLDGVTIPDNVTVLGAIRRDAYRELLAEAQVVVVATKDVQYPSGQSVMLEAMAMAKCCIVTSTPSLSEYVCDDETALLVPPGDPDALRAAIDRARRDPGLRARLGANARRAVDERFNARAMWRRIGEIVQDAAQ